MKSIFFVALLSCILLAPVAVAGNMVVIENCTPRTMQDLVLKVYYYPDDAGFSALKNVQCKLGLSNAPSSLIACTGPSVEPIQQFKKCIATGINGRYEFTCLDSSKQVSNTCLFERIGAPAKMIPEFELLLLPFIAIFAIVLLRIKK